MDLSPIVAWTVPLAGAVISAIFGARRARAEHTSGWGAALFMSLGLGVVLTIVQVLMHGVCIDPLKLCEYRGDGNMGYWFQSFFCIPIYWLIAGGIWQMKQ
jgi:hypothetical protein